MSDDWEQQDWEAESFKPALPGTAAAAAPAAGKGAEYETAGQALLAKASEPDMSKFADEDQEEAEEDKGYHIKPQPKKKVDKNYSKGEYEDDTPLDDPEAERLRRQRLEEESDFRAFTETFGAGATEAKLKQLVTAIPKTAKDFESLAEQVAELFVTRHAGSKNYKVLVKTLLRLAAEPLSAEEAKELENTAGTVRADKVKAEKAAQAAKKGAKRNINVGKGGGTAGLDDYIYDAPAEDDYDFM